MNPDSFGVYTRPDGTRYFILPDQTTVEVTYYNPTTGEYAEVGDNTVYDYEGNDTGKTFSGNSVVTGATQAGSTWLDVLNSGINAAGSIFGHSNTPQPAGTTQYMPTPGAAQPSTGGTVLKVVGVLAVLGVIVWAVTRKSKGKAPAAAAK